MFNGTNCQKENGPPFFNMGLAHHLRTGSSIIKENRQVVVASTTTAAAATTVIWTAASSLPQKQFFHFKRETILEYKHTSWIFWNCSNIIWWAVIEWQLNNLAYSNQPSIAMEKNQHKQVWTFVLNERSFPKERSSLVFFTQWGQHDWCPLSSDEGFCKSYLGSQMHFYTSVWISCLKRGFFSLFSLVGWWGEHQKQEMVAQQHNSQGNLKMSINYILCFPQVLMDQRLS